MSEIQRYRRDSEMRKFYQGEYVKFSDHERAVLQAKIDTFTLVLFRCGDYLPTGVYRYIRDMLHALELKQEASK